MLTNYASALLDFASFINSAANALTLFLCRCCPCIMKAMRKKEKKEKKHVLLFSWGKFARDI
jgi:hypothetical protein